MMKLQDGTRIAIVGGGPAGSLFALYLGRFCAEAGLHPEITVYQDREFDALGPKGCKGCAGVLSMALLRNLEELDLALPGEIIQSGIDHYTVHNPYTSISISNPERGKEILSVYRGGGPRVSNYIQKTSFDGWLLAQVRGRGMNVVHAAVTAVSAGRNACLETDGKKIECDLIVLAGGVSRHLKTDGVDYVPGTTRTMAMDELYAGVDQVQARLGSGAHAFFIPNSDVIFGSMVPKGPFINVTVLSSGDRPTSVADFLKHDTVRRLLPEHYESACGCRPKAVLSSARGYFADRFVAIGDAAVSRLYKDGIGSALLTARQAARTVVEHGFSRQDFERHYEPVCRGIRRDNSWGSRLFAINQKTKDSRLFLLAQHGLMSDEQDNHKRRQPFTRAAWGMLTGSYSYRSIALTSLSPLSLARLLPVMIRDSRRNFVQRRTEYPRRLYVGKRRVLILGSGFAGTYTLRHLVRHLNRNENVETTVVSNENFFLFSPLLHEVATGGVETRHIAYPLRRLHWRDRFNFVQAEVNRIDLDQGQVVTTTATLGYDYLVIALGSVTTPPPFGKAHGGVAFPLKTLRDALRIRDHIVGVFERAARENDPARRRQFLTFVVSGAGYTGVQLVAELSDFIRRTLLRFYKTIKREEVRIVLIEAEPKIMADLHTKLGAYAMKHLVRSGIEVRTKSRVTEAFEGGVKINHGATIPTDTHIWVAGLKPSPRVAELPAARDSLGRVSVDQHLEVPGYPGVYAIGDCASFIDERSGHPIPPRGYTGVRQAKIAARNILAGIRGYEKRLYTYSRTGDVVSLGSSRAVLRFHGLRLYGFPAKVVWLIGYSSLVTGAYNRLRIVNDWLLTRMFGRDTTYLGLEE